MGSAASSARKGKSQNSPQHITFGIPAALDLIQGYLGKVVPPLDLIFGFDDANYSDRTLLLEIVDNAESDATTAPRVSTIHISSLILAGRSGFFRRLFSNGMRESEQKYATLRIETSEEVSFMNLLKHVYSNNLPTTFDALLDLMVIADKFDVDSCLRDCSRSLQNLPMTCESASAYLDLSSSLVTSLSIQPLIEAAKKFLVAQYKELDKFNDEVLNLSLVGIQAVLCSDDLVVTSESVVYYLVLSWAQKHYPDVEERREILKTHLLNLVRFPFMTTRELIEEVKTCVDIDPEFASAIAFRALSFKTGTPHQKHEEGNAASRQFVKRAYKHIPVKVIEFELPLKNCMVFFDLTREEVKNMFPEGQIRSESFHLGSLELYLLAGCSVFTKFNGVRQFWLSLNMRDPTTTNTVEYKITRRNKTSKDFEYNWAQGSHKPGAMYGTEYVTKWEDFIGDDSNYFINDIFQARFELTLKCD